MPIVIPSPPVGLRTVYLGRLGLAAVEDPITESLGSDVTASGDSSAVGQRRPKGFSLVFDVHGFNDPGSVAAGNTMRRQLRSLMQNHPYRLAGLYMNLSPDPERNGWLVIGAAELEDADGGVTFGSYKLTVSQAFLVAAIRSHREGFRCDVTDLRVSTSPRDYLGQIFSTDFAALPNLPLFYLPPGSADTAVLDSRVLTTSQATGRDGACLICAGRSNGDVISWDRPEANFNTGDVVVYDRRGQITAPTAGPDALWEEVYGPDYPWNWLTAGQPQDAPVLDNGLVRVRWDSINTPGFRVDVWNGTAYAEQGKMVVQRVGDVTGFCSTFLSAGVTEYTTDRAVVSVVLANPSDASSREVVYLTVKRGVMGAVVECYPSVKANGTKADAILVWTPALTAGAADVNASIVKIESQGSGSWTPGAAGAAVYVSTAGTGALLPLTTMGNPYFSVAENWVALLRCPAAYNTVGSYQVTLAVQQAANAAAYVNNISNAYGVAQNAVMVQGQNGAGYVRSGVFFTPTAADQVMEAEAMTLGAGWSAVAATGASGGNVAATNSLSDSGTLSRSNWLTGRQGVYRVSARVWLSGAATGSIYAKTTATTGVTRTFSSTVPVWVDLGEIVADGSTLQIHGWQSAGVSLVVDRIEAVLVQDRTRTGANYSGARDQAQAELAMCVPQARRPARAPV